MACWTASNTRTLIGLIIFQLVLTAIITVVVVVMAIYVSEGITKMHTAATHVAGVTQTTAEDLQNATKTLSGSGAQLLGVASKALRGFVQASETNSNAARLRDED